MRFDIQDITLGPEMRSTGEVMGVGRSFGEAYAKALIAAGQKIPNSGGIFSFHSKRRQGNHP